MRLDHPPSRTVGNGMWRSSGKRSASIGMSEVFLVCLSLSVRLSSFSLASSALLYWESGLGISIESTVQ